MFGFLNRNASAASSRAKAFTRPEFDAFAQTTLDQAEKGDANLLRQSWTKYEPQVLACLSEPPPWFLFELDRWISRIFEAATISPHNDLLEVWMLMAKNVPWKVEYDLTGYMTALISNDWPKVEWMLNHHLSDKGIDWRNQLDAMNHLDQLDNPVYQRLVRRMVPDQVPDHVPEPESAAAYVSPRVSPRVSPPVSPPVSPRVSPAPANDFVKQRRPQLEAMVNRYIREMKARKSEEELSSLWKDRIAPLWKEILHHVPKEPEWSTHLGKNIWQEAITVRSFFTLRTLLQSWDWFSIDVEGSIPLLVQKGNWSLLGYLIRANEFNMDEIAPFDTLLQSALYDPAFSSEHAQIEALRQEYFQYLERRVPRGGRRSSRKGRPSGQRRRSSRKGRPSCQRRRSSRKGRPSCQRRRSSDRRR
jgi:hypothetical protein